MSAKFQSIRTRLAKIEVQRVEKKRRIDLANCNCKPILVVNGDSELAAAEEALRSRPCAAHGLNHQTRLIIVRTAHKDTRS